MSTWNASKAIGAHFIYEIGGLVDRRFGWGTDGLFEYADDMLSANLSALQAVVAAHNPAAPVSAAEIAPAIIRAPWSVWTKQVTVSGVTQAGDVAFPIVLPNTNYFVTASVVGFTGSPPPNASVVVWTKFTDRVHGFLAAPPGAGNSVTYEILVLWIGP